MGGAKVSDKLAVIDNLIGKADTILIGGGMSHILRIRKGLRGRPVLAGEGPGRERSALPEGSPREGHRDHYREWTLSGLTTSPRTLTPRFAHVEDLTGGKLGAEAEGLDIGPKTPQIFAEKIKAKTIFWNGPVGVFEIAPFAGGYPRGGTGYRRL